MPKMCEVHLCKNIGHHQFPKNAAIKKLWLKAIRRRNFKPESNSRLCRNHFLESDYQKISDFTGTVHQHRYLKKNAIPSVFPWTTKTLSNESRIAREQRLIARNIKKSLFEPSTSALDAGPEILTEDHHTTPDVAIEQLIEVEKEDIQSVITNKYRSCGTQTSNLLRIFSTDLLITDDKSVMFYTGLETYSKFNLVLSTLLPMANHLKYRWSQVVDMSVEEQLLILLIKLRRNKPDFEIGKMFNISKTEVANIIVTWIHFVYDLWSLIDIWPSRDLVDFYMPETFKDGKSKTRVIVDTTEVPIAKPSNPISQRATYSSYKNTNTIKFLVGSTPGGLLCYCSQGYGGATSNRQMIEHSSLLELCDDGDSVMADRGFNVQDLFAAKNIVINIPAFLKGKSQLPGVVLKHDQRLASQRVHIERLIGLTKTYKILQSPLVSNYVPLASKIFFICLMLCNFREKIIGKNKNM